MKILGEVSDIESSVNAANGPIGEWGMVYSVLECPGCNKPNIVSYEWDDGMESEDEINYELLYPIDKNIPIGLPDHIKMAFQAAHNVKTIDVNAYVILLRRLLELVCIDRQAKGKTLALMLRDLASKS